MAESATLKSIFRALAVLAFVWSVPARGAAETCTAPQFAAAVDKAGAELRAYNKEAQPRLKDRLEKLAATKGWRKNEAEEKGLDYLYDGRVTELDAEANEHLTKIDQLGRVEPGSSPECAKLKELEDAGKLLLGVMTAKSAYLHEKIDRELPEPPVKSAQPDKAPSRETSAREGQPGNKSATAPDTRVPEDHVAARQPPAPAAPAPQFETTIIPSDAFVVDEKGYTIDEIREATRGFFGTISTELASVIEHAFAKSGRPTAYILGSEGGGALLAGLRYGNGTLYLRSGGSQPIYWHGPSIGSDIGASGSRTLYLVYRLKDPNALYRSFAGIDGSAYFVGGVGITFLKGGEIIMAPIRSGIGLRLGANIGYVRFTSQPTWNPF